jgi:hypothetical protein
MNKTLLLGAAMTAATLAAVASSAIAAEREVATLARITGEAVVSAGEKYVSGVEGMALKIGERVMSLAGSRTTIQFSDGCRYVLEENELLTITDKSPCALGMTPTGSGVAGAAGAPAYAGLAAVGVLGATVIVGAASDTGSDDRQSPRPPISP